MTYLLVYTQFGTGLSLSTDRQIIAPHSLVDVPVWVAGILLGAECCTLTAKSGAGISVARWKSANSGIICVSALETHFERGKRIGLSQLDRVRPELLTIRSGMTITL
jgi:hypothetical protein